MAKNKKITILYIFLLYILILQPFLQKKIEIFQYTDEVFALILFGCAIIKIIKNNKKIKVSKRNIIIISCLLAILCLGLLSNIIFGYQELKYVVADIIVFYKFYLVYFSFGFILKNRINEENGEKTIYFHIKLITVILTILTLLNYIFEIFPSGDERYGIKANELFFGHPTALAAMSVFLIANAFIFGKEKQSKYYLVGVLVLLMISTLRMKAIAFAIGAIVLIIYINKFNKKLQLYKLLLVGILCLIISFNQIKFYFIEDNQTARGALFRTSFEIANDYFPIGTGFGTFASNFSGENYSPLYEKYGINDIWGLSAENPAFISDSFWPMIIGQFGYIGAILYMICVILIYEDIQRKYNKEKKGVYTAKILCLLYLVISSIAESAFVNPLAIPLAMILSIED